MVAEAIKDAGGKAFAYQCDLANKDDIERKATQVEQEVGKPTVVINNAGVIASKPFLDLTEKEVRNVLEINTLSHFWVSWFYSKMPKCTVFEMLCCRNYNTFRTIEKNRIDHTLIFQRIMYC